jgi:hypothetical protein
VAVRDDVGDEPAVREDVREGVTPVALAVGVWVSDEVGVISDVAVRLGVPGCGVISVGEVDLLEGKDGGGVALAGGSMAGSEEIVWGDRL